MYVKYYLIYKIQNYTKWNEWKLHLCLLYAENIWSFLRKGRQFLLFTTTLMLYIYSIFFPPFKFSTTQVLFQTSLVLHYVCLLLWPVIVVPVLDGNRWSLCRRKTLKTNPKIYFSTKGQCGICIVFLI